MTGAASSDLRELERLLTVAADAGETLTRSGVQEEFQVSASEADEMLGVLRENGKAVEVAPGEWRGPMLDEMERVERPGPVVVAVPDAGFDADGDARRPVRPARPAGVGVGPGVPNVRLTMAIAEALEAEAIGAIVKAALEGIGADETFVLEVTP